MDSALLFSLQEGLRITQPVFLGMLVRYFEPLSKVTKTQAYLYALAMLLCSLGMTLTILPLTFMRQRIGMRSRVAATTLIYKKVTVLFL